MEREHYDGHGGMRTLFEEGSKGATVKMDRKRIKLTLCKDV